jgi:hypothetical protein
MAEMKDETQMDPTHKYTMVSVCWELSLGWIGVYMALQGSQRRARKPPAPSQDFTFTMVRTTTGKNRSAMNGELNEN